MRIVFMFLAFVVLLGACKGSQPADTTDVLVSVKGRTLNRSEVNKLIPRGISSAVAGRELYQEMGKGCIGVRCGFA